MIDLIWCGKSSSILSRIGTFVSMLRLRKAHFGSFGSILCRRIFTSAEKTNIIFGMDTFRESCRNKSDAKSIFVYICRYNIKRDKIDRSVNTISLLQFLLFFWNCFRQYNNSLCIRLDASSQCSCPRCIFV